MSEANIELCFEVISNAGTAKSLFLKALGLARNGEFEEADKLMAEGHEAYLMGHRVHCEMLQKYSTGENTELSILVTHAQDHMTSAETLEYLAIEIIALRKERREAK